MRGRATRQLNQHAPTAEEMGSGGRGGASAVIASGDALASFSEGVFEAIFTVAACRAAHVPCDLQTLIREIS